MPLQFLKCLLIINRDHRWFIKKFQICFFFIGDCLKMTLKKRHIQLKMALKPEEL